MGYDDIVNRRRWLIDRMQELYDMGRMPRNEFDKFSKDSWIYVVENLDRLEMYIADKYPFLKGQ